ncbi:MAG TPA: sigma-E factor regulatory protein RseB domain-containing protein [Fimbriimonadaceae bacterium]|nr:sigma-E factor regulatory protein RseB domain-containing protein [Fimbriimonadaceae bacterium]
MARINPALTILVFGIAATLCAAGGTYQSESEKARQLLLKTLDRNFSHNVIALISQRSPEDHESFQRIQVQISRDGKMRQTVIYPLSMQGVETIDDGKQSATFLPDEKVTLVQESPRLLPNDTNARINLTVRNYTLKLGGSSQIAGQTATIVVAAPRSRELETRRYHIDERTGFLLQLETVSAGSNPKLAFRALQVTYPARINPATFEINLDERDGQKVIYRRRSGLYDAGPKGTPSIGFEPVLPRDLPFGFDLQDAQINDTGKYRSVAVRITDGLIKGTVYQYSQANAARMKASIGTTIGDGSGIRFVVAADVPESVRKKILVAFIEAARRSNWDRPTGPLSRAELWQQIWSLTQSEQLNRLLVANGSFESFPPSE